MLLLKKEKLEFKGCSTLLGFCAVAFALIFGNVLLACSYTFSCKTFIPTLSFLGAFRNHDRLFVFACTSYTVILQLLSLSFNSYFHASLLKKYRVLSLLLSSCASVCLIGLSVFDEVNGIHLKKVEGLHTVFSVCLWCLCIAWGSVIYAAFSTSKLSSVQDYWLGKLKRLLQFEAFMGILTILEWHYAYQSSWNVFSETNEAFCEWVLVCVGLFTPVVVSKLMPDLKFTLSLSPNLKSLE